MRNRSVTVCRSKVVAGSCRYIALVAGEWTILFDLDGTLSNGGPAMVASLAYACQALGLEVPSEDVLRSFIGPPFSEGLGRHFGLDEARCAEAVAYYRERYVEGGAMYEAVSYPGIVELLARLDRAGARLAVATSKPEKFARKVVAHLGLEPFFAGVFGPAADGVPASKAGVIAAASRALRLAPELAIMVGDRSYDIEGAHANGLAAIGVLWGFGTRAELVQAGADEVVTSAEELAEALARRRPSGDGVATAR